MSISICRGTLGSLAMFTAIRTASSRGRLLAPRIARLNRAGVVYVHENSCRVSKVRRGLSGACGKAKYSRRQARPRIDGYCLGKCCQPTRGATRKGRRSLFLPANSACSRFHHGRLRHRHHHNLVSWRLALIARCLPRRQAGRRPGYHARPAVVITSRRRAGLHLSGAPRRASAICT